MQFIANGPDIPDALLQAHEDGGVVFFCGAGISYPAGLPGFKGLVDDIYDIIGTTKDSWEENAYSRGQYDATLDLLERRIAGQRVAVRKALAQALQPKWRRKGATDTHAALLQLARNRDGALRLVTTNFDHVFSRAAKRTGQEFDAYSAPMLPIPKHSRWSGLVYLHGLLPDKEDESALQRLVLTSGDFGLAYLTERWAARFVSELFRNFVVCFIGYSIDDPVLRYMMDALAADRMLGEVTPQAYALGSFHAGEEDKETTQWKAKGVVPILYETAVGSNDHSALHRTLKVWAETYRDGVLGKERIVVDYALARPSASTRQDDFFGRMLWALTDESGLPAKRFAEFNPVPSLDWLSAFSEDRFRQSDLARFGVSPLGDIDDKLRFSLIRRPAPYRCSPWMALVSGGDDGSRWDDVMFQLARWLVRHLNDPDLVIWVAQHGGQLRDHWSRLIERKLEKFARLKRERKTSELNEIKADSPNAIPSPLMQTLWRLLLSGRVKSPWRSLDFYHWERRLKRDGWTATLRLELRELLTPKVVLKKPFRWDQDGEGSDEPTRIRQLVDWELVLAGDHVHSSLRDSNNEEWRSFLPALLEDFQQLLRDALDLLRELDGADVRDDRSHWDLPSISPHWQNRGFRDWVTLIELLRDAWLATRETDLERARRIALDWFDLPYFTFKRLALFAASQDEIIDSNQWIEWLVGDNAWSLWSSNMQRETMRLLVLQGSNLSPELLAKLEAAILAGPPRDMYVDDLEQEYWQSLVDHAIWLRLAKLQEGGGQLNDLTSQRFEQLSASNPKWELASYERDEFPHWMSGTGDPDYKASRKVDIAPRKRMELVDWLRRAPREDRSFYESTWRETCRTRFFHCVFALCDLAQEGLWPTERWREALQAWSEESLIHRSWQFAAPLVQDMPNDVVEEVLHSLSWWIEAASKVQERHETVLFDLCRRVLALPHQDAVDIDEPVFHAINHPIGHITDALLNVWFKREPNDNDCLPEDIEPFFSQLCDVDVEQFRHGRVILASRLIALFRVDQTWTETELLPLFSWSADAVEAKAVWEGFLWSPRLHRPLLTAFKQQFLETAGHYADLGEHAAQFAAFLTYAALETVEDYSVQDFRTAFEALPQEGLGEAAQAMYQALEGTGEQREDYWKNRIQPFWHDIWPKSRDLASNSIAESLSRMSIASRGEFPTALSAVLDWLQPIEHPDYVVHLLHESDLAIRFPEDALRFLNAVISNQPLAPGELGRCLRAIREAAPNVEQDHRYQRLLEYFRQHEV